MEWSVVLPRCADHLAPDSYLAMVQAPSLSTAWHAEVVPVFAKYSMNQGFRSLDLTAELARHGLFQLTGHQTTEPVPFRQPVADWVEAVHASNGFSRDRMPAEAARECDTALTQIRWPTIPMAWSKSRSSGTSPGENRSEEINMGLTYVLIGKFSAISIRYGAAMRIFTQDA